MAEEPRFDIPAIFRALAIIVGVTGLFGFLVPVIVTLAFKLVNTGPAAGNEIFRWAFWAVAWALTIWQGSVMLRRVHDAIIDDMILTAAIAAVLLLIIKFIMALVYVPVRSNGELVPLLSTIDMGGALILIVVAVIGSRANRF
jgi:hypothetical protein